MATATKAVETVTDRLERISHINAEAAQLEADFRERLEEQQKEHEEALEAKMAEIRELTGDGTASRNGSAKRGRQPQARTQGQQRTQAGKGKRGQQAQAQDEPQGRKGKGRGSNKMSLEKAVFTVLDRNDWPSVKNLPGDAPGLKPHEIAYIINKEKVWSSPTGKLETQLSQALYKLSKVQKKIGRTLSGDHKGRYYVLKGATMD